MALCNITGVVYLPNGALAKSRTLTFRRIDASRPTAEYLGVVLPDDVRTQTSKTGGLDFDILTGNYFVHAEGPDGGFVGRSVVPDAPTAVFSDTIEDVAPVIPNPAWLDQALQARDDAAQSADEAAASASSVSGSAAQIAANTNSIAAHQPWIDGLSPYMQPTGLVDSTVWSPKEWTNTNTTNISLGPTLPDMTTAVIADGNGNPSLNFVRGTRVSRKQTRKKRADSDLLLVARVTVTGLDGLNEVFLGTYYGSEGNATGGTSGGTAIPLIEGPQIIHRVVTRTDIFNGLVVRPYLLRQTANNSATTQVVVHSYQVIEIIGGVFPVLSLNPPRDGTTDAATYIQAMVNAAAGAPGSKNIVDLGGITYAVGTSITVASPMKIRDGNVTAIGTRAAWAGGSTDGAGVPRQKGIFRLTGSGVDFERVTLNCGVYTEIPVVAANWVYSMYKPLANGFEDVSTNQHTFYRCRVVEWDDYGYRYKSASGGGFNLLLSTGSKTPPQKVGASSIMENADAQTGAGVLIDASDCKVHDFTVFGGEYGIQQLPSNGTLEITGAHPWCGASGYNRRYFGTIGTVIETGIQIRTATQISTYDNTKVSVTRRASDWQVIVTMLVDVLQADATPVLIRRDEVVAKLDGWGSSMTDCYIDGGTVRYGTNGLRVNACYGLPGAMGTSVDGIPATMVSVFEFYPAADVTAPSQYIEWGSAVMGKRMIRYPRPGFVAWTPTQDVWTDAILEANNGTNREFPELFEAYNTTGHVMGLRSKASTVRLSMAPAGVADSAAPQFISGAGTPEGVVAAPVGSLFMRTDGGASTTLYVKQSGAGTTGWVAK